MQICIYIQITKPIIKSQQTFSNFIKKSYNLVFKETVQIEVSATNKNINSTLEYVQSPILEQKPT